VHSPNKLNELRMRRKKLHFHQGLANLMGQFHEKFEWGTMPWLRKNKINIKIIGVLCPGLERKK
jgi:hypothetical protein